MLPSSMMLLSFAFAFAVPTPLVNPTPLFDVNGARMDAHDGDVQQWVPGGPYYYYGMSYDRCRFIACGDPTCGHLTDHRVLIWKSATLGNRSWSLVGEALPGSASGAYGTFYRPHVLRNPSTGLYVLVVNLNTHGAGALARSRNAAATSASPEGPFTNLTDMAHLTYRARTNASLGDFGLFHDVGSDGGSAYIAYNVMGAGLGIFVERLAPDWTDGTNGTAISACLNCAPPQPIWKQYEESPAMYRTAAGKYVVLTAGATCFGVPQANGAPWGGTGIFAYVADAPLGPYTFFGDVNSRSGMAGQECAACSPVCPADDGRCALPVQLNSIVRRCDGTPVALTASMWALDVFNVTTPILGDFAEYWQPWSAVVDDAGLPKPLVYVPAYELEP
jgi:hypothetical protein